MASNISSLNCSNRVYKCISNEDPGMPTHINNDLGMNEDFYDPLVLRERFPGAIEISVIMRSYIP